MYSGAEALLRSVRTTSQEFPKVITTLAPRGNVFVFETKLFLQLLVMFPKSAWAGITALILSLLSFQLKIVNKELLLLCRNALLRALWGYCT